MLFLALLLVAVWSAPLDPFTPPDRWEKTHEANPSQDICFQLAITHDEHVVKALEQHLWEVSDPLHKHYGQYLTLEELTKIIRTSELDQRTEAVKKWVSESIKLTTPLRSTVNNDFVQFCTTIGEAEKLLHTRFHVYKHVNSKEPDLTEVARASKSLSIPDEIADNLDFIGGANAPIHHRSKISHYGGAGVTNVNSTLAETITEDTLRSSSSKRNDIHVGAAKLIYVTPGDTEIAAGWQVFCKNGKPNRDDFDINHPTSSICASSPPTITGFEFIMTDKDDDAKALPVLPRACKRGKGAIVNDTFPFFHPVNEASHCGAVVGTVGMYEPLRISIRTQWSDGTISDSASSNSVFATDFATSDFLKNLYDIPAGIRVTHPRNSQAVAEFLEQYYNPEDLDTYLDMMGLPREKVYRTVGPNNATEGSLTGGEAQLDIQVMMGLAPGAKTWFWSVAGRDSVQEEPFLKWLMDLSEMSEPPLVHSVSYADAEDSMPLSYTNRLNVEFMKLGLRGVTLLFASGDDGSSGGDNCKKSEPDFPSSSPFVLSVGATQLTDKGSPVALEKWRGVDIATTKKERTCSSDSGGVITSGGGFSNRYARPKYQEKAVRGYLHNSAIELPPSSFYNKGGRAYPDISAYGNNFVVIMGGQIVRMSGTSASTPVIAAMITLWNDIRLSNDQPPLGFVNPLLYYLFEHHPEVYSDVVIGDNKCARYNVPCCDNGFVAGAGWDAVTGLGSPNFRAVAGFLRGEKSVPYAEDLIAKSSVSPSVKKSEDGNFEQQLLALNAVQKPVSSTGFILFCGLTLLVLLIFLIKTLCPSWLPFSPRKTRTLGNVISNSAQHFQTDRFYGTLDE